MIFYNEIKIKIDLISYRLYSIIEYRNIYDCIDIEEMINYLKNQ